ncbi:MAG: 4Fe-4S ferredoxin [Methanoculleus sp. SDB]|nr:MAG: 4Fe-4S ferredoxin [Methanoculleus sp. SDB]
MAFDSYTENTLLYFPERCINCGKCSTVCPHGVFAAGEGCAVLARRESCMECGACMINCPVQAITVESGVGCAQAMIHAALTGGEETCGCCGEEGGGSNGACCSGWE